MNDISSSTGQSSNSRSSSSSTDYLQKQFYHKGFIVRFCGYCRKIICYLMMNYHAFPITSYIFFILLNLQFFTSSLYVSIPELYSDNLSYSTVKMLSLITTSLNITNETDPFLTKDLIGSIVIETCLLIDLIIFLVTVFQYHNRKIEIPSNLIYYFSISQFLLCSFWHFSLFNFIVELIVYHQNALQLAIAILGAIILGFHLIYSFMQHFRSITFIPHYFMCFNTCVYIYIELMPLLLSFSQLILVITRSPYVCIMYVAIYMGGFLLYYFIGCPLRLFEESTFFAVSTVSSLSSIINSIFMGIKMKNPQFIIFIYLLLVIILERSYYALKKLQILRNSLELDFISQDSAEISSLSIRKAVQLACSGLKHGSEYVMTMSFFVDVLQHLPMSESLIYFYTKFIMIFPDAVGKTEIARDYIDQVTKGFMKRMLSSQIAVLIFMRSTSLNRELKSNLNSLANMTALTKNHIIAIIDSVDTGDLTEASRHITLVVTYVKKIDTRYDALRKHLGNNPHLVKAQKKFLIQTAANYSKIMKEKAEAMDKKNTEKVDNLYAYVKNIFPRLSVKPKNADTMLYTANLDEMATVDDSISITNEGDETTLSRISSLIDTVRTPFLELAKIAITIYGLIMIVIPIIIFPIAQTHIMLLSENIDYSNNLLLLRNYYKKMIYYTHLIEMGDLGLLEIRDVDQLKEATRDIYRIAVQVSSEIGSSLIDLDVRHSIYFSADSSYNDSRIHDIVTFAVQTAYACIQSTERLQRESYFAASLDATRTIDSLFDKDIEIIDSKIHSYVRIIRNLGIVGFCIFLSCTLFINIPFLVQISAAAVNYRGMMVQCFNALPRRTRKEIVHKMKAEEGTDNENDVNQYSIEQMEILQKVRTMFIGGKGIQKQEFIYYVVIFSILHMISVSLLFAFVVQSTIAVEFYHPYKKILMDVTSVYITTFSAYLRLWEGDSSGGLSYRDRVYAVLEENLHSLNEYFIKEKALGRITFMQLNDRNCTVNGTSIISVVECIDLKSLQSIVVYEMLSALAIQIKPYDAIPNGSSIMNHASTTFFEYIANDYYEYLFNQTVENEIGDVNIPVMKYEAGAIASSIIAIIVLAIVVIEINTLRERIRTGLRLLMHAPVDIIAKSRYIMSIIGNDFTEISFNIDNFLKNSKSVFEEFPMPVAVITKNGPVVNKAFVDEGFTVADLQYENISDFDTSLERSYSIEIGREETLKRVSVCAAKVGDEVIFTLTDKTKLDLIKMQLDEEEKRARSIMKEIIPESILDGQVTSNTVSLGIIRIENVNENSDIFCQMIDVISEINISLSIVDYFDIITNHIILIAGLTKKEKSKKIAACLVSFIEEFLSWGKTLLHNGTVMYAAASGGLQAAGIVNYVNFDIYTEHFTKTMKMTKANTSPFSIVVGRSMCELLFDVGYIMREIGATIDDGDSKQPIYLIHKPL